MSVTHKHLKLQILEDCLGEYKQQGDEFLFYCPFCNHHRKKLSVNLRKDVVKCWVCKWSSGSVYFLVKQAGNRNQCRKWSEIDESAEYDTLEEKFFQRFKDCEEGGEDLNVDLPPSYQPLSHYPAHAPVTYLMERGAEVSDIHRMQIGYSSSGEYEGRVIFPSFDREGSVNFFVARTYKDEYPKYLTASANKHNIIFNEMHINWDQPVHLVEGVFDAIMAGENAVPILGNDIAEDSLLMQRIVENDPDVYLALDADAEEELRKIANLLLEYDISCYSVPVGEGDVGDMSKQEYRNKSRQASRVTGNSLFIEELKYG